MFCSKTFWSDDKSLMIDFGLNIEGMFLLSVRSLLLLKIVTSSASIFTREPWIVLEEILVTWFLEKDISP